MHLVGYHLPRIGRPKCIPSIFVLFMAVLSVVINSGDQLENAIQELFNIEILVKIKMVTIWSPEKR